jgi:hypothetical protein
VWGTVVRSEGVSVIFKTLNSICAVYLCEIAFIISLKHIHSFVHLYSSPRNCIPKYIFIFMEYNSGKGLDSERAHLKKKTLWLPHALF